MASENNTIVVFRAPAPALLSKALGSLISERRLSDEDWDGPEAQLGSMSAGVIKLFGRNVPWEDAKNLIAKAKKAKVSIAVHQECLSDYESDSEGLLSFYDHNDGRDLELAAGRNSMQPLFTMEEVEEVLGNSDQNCLARLKARFSPPADLASAF